jgi:hypothetical protein
VDVRAEWVRGEQFVQFWVGLTAEDCGFPWIAVDLRLEGIRDCWKEGTGTGQRRCAATCVGRTFHNAFLANRVCAVPMFRFFFFFRARTYEATYPTRISVLAGLAQPFVSDFGIRVSQLLTVPLSSSAAAIP